MKVTISHLTKNFHSMDGNVAALKDVSFEVEKGQFYTLLGPSGCGKSTTLRCIAGLEDPDGGEIWFGDQMVAGPGISVPSDQRPIGMVFQSYAIWPHMTVFNNVAFPLKYGRARFGRAERKRRVMEVLSLMQMEHLADRPAPYLSGGQQQRVALARALVSSSEVLLLDEPLSNLDAKLREDLRIEIKDLTRKFGVTTVYVTHDQLEALAMSDRVAVMLGGKIIQEAGPREVYLNPKTGFVAQFVGQINFFNGTVTQTGGDGYAVIETSHGVWRCLIASTFSSGDSVRVAVRPEGFTLSTSAEVEELNVLDGKVEKATFLGEAIETMVSVGDQVVTAKIPPKREILEGQDISLRFAPDACLVLPQDSD